MKRGDFYASRTEKLAFWNTGGEPVNTEVGTGLLRSRGLIDGDLSVNLDQLPVDG